MDNQDGNISMTEAVETRSYTPHILIGAVAVIIVVAVLLWPSTQEEIVESVVEPTPQPETIEPIEPELVEPEVFEPTPIPDTMVVEGGEDTEPFPAVEEETTPDPIDISDQAISAALSQLAGSETLVRMMVSDAILQRFVVTVTNLADMEMAPNHRLFTPPSKSFRIYQQADREWIDAASYKRYTPYVNALETLDNQLLLDLYNDYQGEIQAIYGEIADPDDSFSDVLISAIENLLETPEVPVPVEVYSDAVMYKYADERLESLSAPQKQLLRTGPDNMRRIKAKLRELKALITANGPQ